MAGRRVWACSHVSARYTAAGTPPDIGREVRRGGSASVRPRGFPLEISRVMVGAAFAMTCESRSCAVSTPCAMLLAVAARALCLDSDIRMRAHCIPYSRTLVFPAFLFSLFFTRTTVRAQLRPLARGFLYKPTPPRRRPGWPRYINQSRCGEFLPIRDTDTDINQRLQGIAGQVMQKLAVSDTSFPRPPLDEMHGKNTQGDRVSSGRTET